MIPGSVLHLKLLPQTSIKPISVAVALGAREGTTCPVMRVHLQDDSRKGKYKLTHFFTTENIHHYHRALERGDILQEPGRGLGHHPTVDGIPSSLSRAIDSSE